MNNNEFKLTKAGVRHWNDGTQLELIYIIETTRHDEEMNLSFSNILQKECHSLNDIIHIFNVWQNAGYQNISISTHVKKDNNIIIEDCSASFELSVNSEKTKELIKENEQLKNAKWQVELYKDFIKKYKAEKTFEKYITEEQTSNKDNSGLYWYEMLFRPLSPFCQPKNHIKYDDTKGRHGIIAYDRPLTSEELEEYELRKWNDISA